ncbi:MAG: hypothetical protein ACI38A_07170 [Candidatus Ornithomonoglobus sp.]
MKNRRKLTAVLLSMSMLAASVSAFAENGEVINNGDFIISEDTEEPSADITASGTCGENLTWTLDSSGVLTISGEGGYE